MQVKKDEVRSDIIRAAREEFFRRGYEASSLRIIARKAHVSPGNIYLYFPGKEALLEAVLLPSINRLENLLVKHLETENNVSQTANNAFTYQADRRLFIHEYELQFLLDKNLFILLKLDSTKLTVYKEKFLKSFRHHLAWHLNFDDERYSIIFLNMLLECGRQILLEYPDLIQARQEFMKILHLLCFGFIDQLSTLRKES